MKFGLSIRRYLQVSSVTFRRDPVIGPSGSTDHEGKGGYRIYRNLSLLVFVPIILILAANMYACKQERERPPFVNYEYLRIRTKRFPWGDGVRSLFHNPKLNALPDGYEALPEEEREDAEKDE